jgi:hypothetical protein
VATQTNSLASAWTAGLPKAELWSFDDFTDQLTCPKCGFAGWLPRLGVQWHASHADASTRACPPVEHLHASCPCCAFAAFFETADAQRNASPVVALTWVN